MPGPQATPFQITSPDQAEALLNFTYGARLLEQFLEPSTSSRAAHALAEPANRVAYHVRKLAGCGLLCVAGHQGKRVLYQAAAQTFSVPRALVRLDDPSTLIRPVMEELTAAYVQAIVNWQSRHPSEPLLVNLSTHGQAAEPPPEEPYLPAMRLRAVRMTPEQYRQAQAALDHILTGMDCSDLSADARPATFVLMAFPGQLHQD
ncbi:hypothetical protein K7W42_10245 [Deinococcus sp. HMF7604]|uniref:hypothetical protein n=1 Tax=Deinococcus betulae TaxID=2873312 RepID=UPI001CC9EABA|nr:hypothetical protein [Deinococcus betulae]MBZ9751244.1 hypothetical protein [Deinococcus betulae]